MDSVNCIQTFVSSEWKCDFFYRLAFSSTLQLQMYQWDSHV